MRKYNPTDSKITLDENGNVKFTYEAKVKEEGPCWTGFKQVGTKMKNGKQVPNCVPIDEADMTAISSWKAKLKKMKGLSKQQMQLLSTLPTPVITSLINTVGMVVNSNDPDIKEEMDAQRKAKFASGAAGGPNSSSKRKKMDEAPLVMSDMDIVKSLTQKIEDDLHKLKIRKQFEKGWSTIQALAKLAGYKVTKTAQQKGKTFRYDIKK